jgi:hypothetical protein
MRHDSDEGEGVKPLARHIVAVLTLLCLLLCIALAALWLHSYRMEGRLWYSPARGVNYRLAVGAGSIILSRSVLSGRTSGEFSDDFDRPPGRSLEWRHRTGPPVSPFTPEGSPRLVQWLGFDYLARDVGRPSFGTLAFRRVVLPMWLPVLLAALPPAIALARRERRRRRTLKGLCPRCGYDLRASPGRCPECGRIPPKSA